MWMPPVREVLKRLRQRAMAAAAQPPVVCAQPLRHAASRRPQVHRCGAGGTLPYGRSLLSCRALHDGQTAAFSTVPRPATLSRLDELRARLGEDAAPKAARMGAFVPPSLIGPDILTDTLGREHTYLRISLTEKCSLRCTYCMPAEGVPLQPKDKILSTDEVVRLAEMFVAAGIKKIRLTGGEPLVHPDIVEICQRIGALPGLNDLGITTNGLVLEKKLPELQAAGVNQLNVGLDTLVPEKFEFITRRKGFSRVVGAIEAAVRAGYHHAGTETIKVNVCVMNGFNEDELSDFVSWCAADRIRAHPLAALSVTGIFVPRVRPLTGRSLCPWTCVSSSGCRSEGTSGMTRSSTRTSRCLKR